MTDDTARESPADSLLAWAWTVIANAGHNQGGWAALDPEWVKAAEAWRDAYHATLPGQTSPSHGRPE